MPQTPDHHPQGLPSEGLELVQLLPSADDDGSRHSSNPPVSSRSTAALQRLVKLALPIYLNYVAANVMYLVESPDFSFLLKFIWAGPLP
jgi:hypothetical protein